MDTETIERASQYFDEQLELLGEALAGEPTPEDIATILHDAGRQVEAVERATGADRLAITGRVRILANITTPHGTLDRHAVEEFQQSYWGRMFELRD